ncbi:YlaI family protein [Cytobacillus sp. Hz8]|uniref:YlaI family protein n=1 Tax=Cytobacillus sp. Hz8 TaxID=3347168 RepID=UPI0035E0093B
MRVKCVLCDKIENIDDYSFQAKRLRNRPIHTYMCMSCEERITKRTNERKATGNFHLYRQRVQEEEW